AGAPLSRRMPEPGSLAGAPLARRMPEPGSLAGAPLAGSPRRMPEPGSLAIPALGVAALADSPLSRRMPESGTLPLAGVPILGSLLGFWSGGSPRTPAPLGGETGSAGGRAGGPVS